MDRNISRFVQGKFVKRITYLNNDLSIKNETIIDLNSGNCSENLLNESRRNFDISMMFCADISSNTIDIVG